MKKIAILFSLIPFTLLTILSCSQNEFSRISSQILSKAGVPGSQHVGTALEAGSKVVKAAEGLTEEQEYYLGRSVAATILSRYSLLRDPALTEYVNRVGRAVAMVSDRPEVFSGYHFAVLNSQELNAISAPAGFVFITKGLLKRMPDEDALAAVLAHEVAHVVKGHGTSAISSSNLSEALLLIGKDVAASQGGAPVSALTSAFGNSVTDITNTILENGYSRSQEYDADEYAAELLTRAGYDAHAIITMLEAIEKGGASKGGWMDTHPSPSKRIDNVDGDVPENADTSPGKAVRASRFKAATRTLG